MYKFSDSFGLRIFLKINYPLIIVGSLLIYFLFPIITIDSLFLFLLFLSTLPKSWLIFLGLFNEPTFSLLISSLVCFHSYPYFFLFSTNSGLIIYLFIFKVYFWLFWVFVAACRHSLVAAGRSHSLMEVCGCLRLTASLVLQQGSRHTHLDSYST